MTAKAHLGRETAGLHVWTPAIAAGWFCLVLRNLVVVDLLPQILSHGQIQSANF